MNITSTKSNFNEFNVSCNGDNNGSIDITVNGGYLDSNTVYTYSWSTLDGSGLDPNSEDQTGLSAGTYTIVATDTNGCAITQDVEITQPNVLDITETISDYNGFQISEAGENDGSIDITVSGGTSNYTYEWSTQNGSGLSINSEDQSGLTAGVYTVLITDSNNCQISKTYTLTQPIELLIALDHDANGNSILCYGDASASIKIDITQGSIAPYTYSINGTTYLNENYSQSFNNITALTYTFTNLSAGKYSITVTDANGVNKTTGLKEIVGPIGPLSISGSSTDITCNGDNDGKIDITITGGGGSSNQALYFYSWTTSDGSGLNQTAEDQTGLGPGTYTVVAKDINECSLTKSFTITEQPPLTYNLDSIKNITCNGDNDGEINITVGGGTGNYTYEWSTENGSGLIQGQEDQSGLGPGDYKLLLRDGCNTFEYIYTISTTDTLEIVQDEKVNILCHDDSTGIINITVNGGTTPYNYVWKDNFGNVYDRNIGNIFNDGDLSNIPSGVYDLIVTDANGCIATFSTELTQPEDLVIDIQKTDLNCYNSNNGTITVTPSGGIAPYSYSWSDFGNGNARNDLAAGTYNVTIKDSNECAETRTIEIENADLFDVNPIVTPISCFGADDGSIELNFEGGVSPITFIWNDDSTAGQNRYNLSPGVYSVLIQDSSGCEIQRDFTIIEPQEISIAGVITNAIDCDNPASGSIDLQISGGNPPYTFQWSNGATNEDISGLIANNYLIKVTDSKGCSSEKEFVINRQEDLEINLSTNLYAICDVREVYQKNSVSVSGGVAPYVIQWSNGIVTGNNNEIMDTKIEGSYQVTVTDALGCSESIIFEVSKPEIGFPDLSYDSFYLSTYGALAVNDAITFTNLSTDQYFNVFWDFGDGNNSQEINPSHAYIKRGVYDVTLTVEFILGCSYSITKTIYVGDSYEIVIPNAFTPNNDGYNDTFRPIYYGFKYLKMQIFDTWGNLIYNEESTSNELNGWKGRISGKDGENGNYFYQVSGNTQTDEKFSQNGTFTLIK
jgi:gliding motility-associated-like protein